MSNFNNSKLRGKVVWLTGASSGIGEALAKELAKRGAKLALTARRKEVLDGLVSQMHPANPNLLSIPGDVENLATMHAIANQIREKFGQIDILIANAGNHIFTKPEEFNSKEYLYLMNLNFGGMLHCIEAVLPEMIKRKSGRIVGMGSLAGYRGLPRAAAYGASKAAITHFLESIRFHLERHKIGVTIISPGFVKTPLTDKNDFRMPFLIDSPKAAKIIANGIERNSNEISFPIPFNWSLKLMRIIPYPLYHKIIDRLW